MGGKNFITVCKWICGGWMFYSCTLLMGQVPARPMPDSKAAGRPGSGTIHHRINPPTGTPADAGRGLRNRMNQAYGKLPLSFEPNQGQANRQVKFLSRGEGYTLFLTGDAAVLALQKPGGRSQESGVRSQELVARHPRESGDPSLDGFLPQALDGNDRLISLAARHSPDATDHRPRTADAVLRIKMMGSNPTAKVQGLNDLPGNTNYFIGKDPKNWRTNVPNYAKVKYEGVYPGVDLVYYGNQRHIEFDFVVAPGTDPRIIMLDFAVVRELPPVAAVSDQACPN